MNIQLSDEEKIRVLNGDDLYGIMQKILLRADSIDRDREHFWIVGLSNSNRILFIELIGLGSVNATIAEPMDVFSFALQKRAVKVVLVHNHPSGSMQPSDADKDLTDNLIQAGNIVHTEVYDHLIITETSYYSFNASGLMAELKKSLKYVPAYEVEKKMRKEAELLAERSAVLAKSEVVLTMLRKGVDVNAISEYTGISIEEVELLKSEG
ncbi:MAG: DNA repair protein RadC [Crocinitomicaceae bacterium]|jgi:DNA repair protein RadC